MSFTAEDVFWVYGRNKTEEYSNCVKLNKECPNLFDGKCYCCSDDVVSPLTIGERDVPCRLNVKTYIKPGEECSICLEAIHSQNNAYLTSCGHAFHRKCIFKIYETKWNTIRRTPCTINCPICRRYVGEPEYQRYNYENSSGLDLLENFWLCKDYELLKLCFSNKKHYMGMKKDCKQCKEYCETGKFCVE